MKNGKAGGQWAVGSGQQWMPIETSHLLLLAAALFVSWQPPMLLAQGQTPPAITVAKDHIDFLVGDRLLGRYHIGPDVAKPYFWPLQALDGVAMTRGWPMAKAPAGGSTDHPHQKSAWFCHGDVIPEGMTLAARIKGVAGVDFWSEANGHGKIVTTEVGKPQTRENQASIATRNDWRTSDDRKILEERRTIHLYHFGDTVLFTFDIDLAATEVPITFGDTKEGSFGIRINDLLREAKGRGKIENADGKVGEKNCWGQLSPWCDYSGPLEGQVVGLAILDDPANRYPACWHSRDYGLMAANPFGRAHSGFPAMRGRKDLVKLAKGEELKLRYGLLIHPGDARTGKVAEFFDKFVKLKDK
jgi:hypothetical protein